MDKNSNSTNSIQANLPKVDNKFKRIKLVINTYLDGLGGKFDNNKPNRLLYKK